VADDYPEQLLARDPAPSYAGEGPFALWHFSEDPSLGWFRPRVPPADPGRQPVVWAVDTRHAPMFWFPRDCHVIEAAWLRRLQACRLYAYRLPAGAFRPHEVGGYYWGCHDPVAAIGQELVGDLAARHAGAQIELRITPSIWPFWRRVVGSTVGFSGMRLRNAAPHPDQLA
jgi:uncharacterized protein DUF6886